MQRTPTQITTSKKDEADEKNVAELEAIVAKLKAMRDANQDPQLPSSQSLEQIIEECTGGKPVSDRLAPQSPRVDELNPVNLNKDGQPEVTAQPANQTAEDDQFKKTSETHRKNEEKKPGMVADPKDSDQPTPAPTPSSNSTVSKVIAGVALGVGLAGVTFAVLAAASVSIMATVAAASAFLGLMVTNWPILAIGGGVLTVASLGYFWANRNSDETYQQLGAEDHAAAAPLQGGNGPGQS